MNILMAASEMTPLVRSGDLADSLASLTGELRELGHEVTVVLPFYRTIREDKTIKTRKTGVKFSVAVGSSRFPCEIFECKAPNGVQVFLVSRDEYFDRTGLYGTDGRDYQDNSARFIYFTKCVIELARRVEPAPSVLHLHSWQTALAPVFVRDQKLPFKTVLTPHGLEFQGNFWSYDFGLTNLSGDYFSPQGVEYFGSMNCLKSGILYADGVVLPGERFVAAAQTPVFGCGLDPVLREQQHKLYGIPSNHEVKGWTEIKSPRRGDARAAFLKAVGLDPKDPRAVFVCFTEASDGVDSLLGALDRLFVEDVRVVLLGPVKSEFTIGLEVARRKYQGRFCQLDSFDETLARQALAGSDFLLIPGAVEPHATWLRRGLLQGLIPVAAQCGGLFQLVGDWQSGRDRGEGFIFYRRTADGLLDACRRAMSVLDEPASAATLRAHGAAKDFSSAVVAQDHAALYERLVGPVTKAA